MENTEIKQELSQEEVTPKTEIESKSVSKDIEVIESKPTKTKINYFQCSNCNLKERFEFFGKDPPFYKNYILLEDSYIIEDPFAPPKEGEIIVLGAHCVICSKCVCKDVNCSIYFDGTHCIICAKQNFNRFPKAVQEKINRIVS